VFELEPPASDVMRRPPRGRREHLFEARRVMFAIVLGVAAFVGPFAIVSFAHVTGSADTTVRTLGFIALVAADLALVVASRGWPWSRGERNPATRWMLVTVVLLVALALALPWTRTLFLFEAVHLSWVALAVVVGAVPVLSVSVVATGRRTPLASVAME
jgi:Ca2+-transporting ATPase